MVFGGGPPQAAPHGAVLLCPAAHPGQGGQVQGGGQRHSTHGRTWCQCLLLSRQLQGLLLLVIQVVVWCYRRYLLACSWALRVTLGYAFVGSCREASTPSVSFTLGWTLGETRGCSPGSCPANHRKRATSVGGSRHCTCVWERGCEQTDLWTWLQLGSCLDCLWASGILLQREWGEN